LTRYKLLEIERFDIGKTHTELGNRTTGLDIHRHLTAAVQAYNKVLEVYTRETLPQQWAMTQNNLGATPSTVALPLTVVKLTCNDNGEPAILLLARFHA